MKIAISGTGSIGTKHIQNIMSLREEIGIVIIRSNKREDHLSKSIEAEVVTTVYESVEAGAKALVIANPSALHADMAIEGLKLKLDMYIEKPIAVDEKQLRELKRAKNTNDVIIQCGCNLRFLPSLVRFKDLANSGLIGRIIRASFEAGQWLPSWRKGQDYRKNYSSHPELGGGVILDLIHEIDAALWILGDLDLIASIKTLVPELNIETEGAALSLLQSLKKTLVYIGIDYVARQPLRRYQLIGEMGTLTWDLSNKKITCATEDQQNDIVCAPIDFEIEHTYRKSMEFFLNSIEHRTVSVQPLAEGIKAAELAIRMRGLQ